MNSKVKKLLNDNPKLWEDEAQELVENGYEQIYALWDNESDMAHEELQCFLSRNDYAMIENYFDFEKWGDDLLDSDRYFVLKSGRIVAVE